MERSAYPITESIRHWELAVDSLSDLLLLVDQNGVLLRANRAVDRWDLSSVTDSPGRPVHDLLHPNCEDEDCYLRRFVTPPFRDSDNDATRRELERDDEQLGRWVHVTLEELSDVPWRGDLLGLQRPAALITLRDTTEIHRQRLRLGRRTRFETIHHLGRHLAHEVGNPLAAMRTTVEVMAMNFDQLERAKIDSYLTTILEGTERLEAILNRTVNSERLPELDPAPISTSVLLSRIVRLFSDDFAAQDIEFEFDSTLEEPAPILIDLIAAEEVLVNVVRNAMEASERGGRIRLSSLARADRVEITVRDEGVGMDPIQLSTVFEPFVTSKSGGFGIGLAYSKYLMKRMGGDILLQSRKGLGTSTTLLFPRAAEESG